MLLLFSGFGCAQAQTRGRGSTADAEVTAEERRDARADSKWSLRYSANTPLYTSDAKAHRIAELPDLLDQLFASGKPVIVFVHGRGDEPQKSLKGGKYVEGKAVHKLEKQYDARVLMFNWDSKATLWDRTKPLSHMKEAANNLKSVLDWIKEYRAHKYQDRPLVLLAHSMGAIVVQTVVSEYGWPASNPRMFSNVVLTGADADNKGHEKWLGKISAVENVYVSVNYDDNILKKSDDDRPKGVLPLGRNPGPTLAKQTFYVDITDLSDRHGKKTDRHEVFNKRGMHAQVHVCRLFDTMLKGHEPVFSNANVVKVAVPKQRYALKFERNENDPCFK